MGVPASMYHEGLTRTFPSGIVVCYLLIFSTFAIESAASEFHIHIATIYWTRRGQFLRKYPGYSPAEPYIAAIALLQLIIVASLTLFIVHHSAAFGHSSMACDQSIVIVVFAPWPALGTGRVILQGFIALLLLGAVNRRIDDCFSFRRSRTAQEPRFLCLAWRRILCVRVPRICWDQRRPIKPITCVVCCLLFIVNTEFLPILNHVQEESDIWGFGQASIYQRRRS